MVKKEEKNYIMTLRILIKVVLQTESVNLSSADQTYTDHGSFTDTLSCDMGKGLTCVNVCFTQIRVVPKSPVEEYR